MRFILISGQKAFFCGGQICVNVAGVGCEFYCHEFDGSEIIAIAEEVNRKRGAVRSQSSGNVIGKIALGIYNNFINGYLSI